LQGELRKIKPPSFDGENKKGEDAEAWLLGMRKYFQLHDYSSNVEARIAAYHLQGKASMWWDRLKQVKHLDEKIISWKQFKKYFQQQYLSEQYYDKKMQELFELKLGNMTMDEYERKFLELLRYVSFIRDEKVKIQRFLSGLPSFYKDKIQFDEPKNLEEAIRKDKYLYEKNRGRPTFQKAWDDKKKGNMDQRKKGFKPPFIRNRSQAYQQGKPSQGDQKMTDSLGKRPRQQPIKCWGCEGDHMYKYCPHRGDKMKTLHSIKQEETIEDVGKSMPRIYAALDNRQADYQSHMIEVEGKIDNHPIAILIDSGASHSYIDPNLVEIFKLKKCKHEKSWLVQLATGTKRRINELVKEFPINMNGTNTKEDLNIIPLGSYDCLIGMDWLENHRVVLDCYNKVFTCLDEEGNSRTVQGIPRPISVLRDFNIAAEKKF
jgi:hypothetical protein